MTLQDRIKKVRKDNGLNQADFGKRLGLSESAICNYENGRREVSEQSLVSICREFNINYDWLKNEEGTEKPDEEIDVLIDTLKKTYNLSDLDIKIIQGYIALSDSEREAFRKFIQKIKGAQ